MDTHPGERLRVLSISHTSVSRAAGRLRYHPFADRSDLDVHLVVPERWYQFGRWSKADPADDPGVTVHPLPIRLPRAGLAKWYLHHYPSLAKLVRILQPHVIHLWEEPWSMVALQAALVRDREAPNAALVIEADQNILRWLPPPFETTRRYVLRRAELVLARSDEAARVVRGSGYRGPTSLIGYGVAHEIFHPRDRIAARLHFGFDGFTIGYVGRLVEEKGLDDAIEALATLDRRVTLAVLGEGPHRAALLDHANRCGVADRVRWFDWADPAGVATFMGALDVLILLTRTTSRVREQFGRVIVEAQACGTPVLGSDCGAIPIVVGEGGWIVPECQPVAVANCVRKLLDDPAERERAAAAGLHQARLNYTFKRVADTLVDAWRLAVERRAEHRLASKNALHFQQKRRFSTRVL